jgi:hypothetical protein
LPINGHTISCARGTWKARSAGRLQTFSDNYTLSDGEQIIELYHVEQLDHSDNMTIAYLPKQKMVINADMYAPPPVGGNLPNVSANAVALYRNIKRLKLDVSNHGLPLLRFIGLPPSVMPRSRRALASWL